MKYNFSPDIQAKAEEISRILFPHVDINNINQFLKGPYSVTIFL